MEAQDSAELRYYKVLYDFESVDAVELSVTKGSYVVAPASQPESSGWLQVETLTDAKKTGFVPEGYLQQVDASEALPHGKATKDEENAKLATTLPQQQQQPIQQQLQASSLSTPALDPSPSTQPPSQHQDPPPFSTTPASVPAPVHETIPTMMPSSAAYASPAHGEYYSKDVASEASAGVFKHIGGSPDGIQSGGDSTGRLTPSLGAAVLVSRPTARESSAPPSNAGLVESFMKNEVYFRSLMKQRQETFLKLDSCINETAAEVATCKAKNSVLAKKIRELDNMIEEDRAKWRGRVEEEKKLLLSQTNNNLGILNTSFSSM